MSSVVSQIGSFAVDAAIILGWWFAISVVVAIGWSVFHMRLNRRRAPQPAPESARLLLVVPRPKRAPDNDTTPSRPAA